MNLKFPKYSQPIFRPKRYKVLYGGRGSAKSWSVARALILRALEKKTRILCAREIQKSIQDSVHKLLSDQIELMKLGKHFRIQNNYITCLRTNSTFLFEGLYSNTTKIKSMEGIDICWIEEAEKVSKSSWEILIPTIRKEGSEIWITFNPDKEDDPTYQRFVVKPPKESVVIKANWRDNPWLSDELRAEKDYLFKVDAELAMHVWEGECRTTSDAQILKDKWRVEAFEPEKSWNGPYFGADWGFAKDPTTLVKLYINDRKLYVRSEAYGIGVDIDKTPDLFDRVSESRDYVIRADNARPETISYLSRFFRIEAAKKWSGSVEDGVAYLRQFEEIIIHPDCPHTAFEAKSYSYKTDRLSGDVLPVILDKHNHCFDAVRYALEPLISNNVVEWSKKFNNESNDYVEIETDLEW